MPDGSLPDDITLALKAQAGDNQAMEDLVNRYKSLVRQKASAMYILGADTDDVIQEGMIGLFKAIRDFQPTQGASFATFANRCISAQITDAVRQASRKKHQPLNESISLQQLLAPELLEHPAADRDIPASQEDLTAAVISGRTASSPDLSERTPVRTGTECPANSSCRGKVTATFAAVSTVRPNASITL
jgi:RNA polymerase sigma factor (sigma-70 family)